MTYQVGDIVFWATASTAGEYPFIGIRKATTTVGCWCWRWQQRLALRSTRTNQEPELRTVGRVKRGPRSRLSEAFFASTIA